MQDACGRTFAYLRLSLTRRCNMRCVYCRPASRSDAHADHVAPSEPPLSVAEIVALVEHLARRHGLAKVRLTGGEPTCHDELTTIIRSLTRIPGVRETTLTTNGLTLARQAESLADAGLRRINISLDALDPGVFAHMTGATALPHVLAGIAAARRAGLDPIKLNTVVMRGINDGELPGLVRYAARLGVEIRFIELMPMGPLAPHWARHYVPECEMRDMLDGTVAAWRPLATADGPRPDSARRYAARLIGDQTATIGFITPMSCDFCHACNRVRITSDGALFPCLMGAPALSLLPALRPRFDGDRLSALLATALADKQPVHPAAGAAVMTELGG